MNNFESHEQPKQYLRFKMLEPNATFGGASTVILEERETPGEFVLIDGVVHPNPGAYFSPAMAYLFPGILRSTPSSEYMSLSAKVEHRPDGMWEYKPDESK
jgi:hypothetical protein